MRNTSLLIALMLAGSGVFAQQAPAERVRTESATSPFTYEALGATPSIQLRRAAPAADASRAAAARPAADASQKPATAVATTPAQGGRPHAAAPATSTTH
jgi:hypothetical protein